jgi:pimeloyl-ACP methyl ester carboxylesterase
MRSLRALRALARQERRLLLMHPRRSLLVVLLVAVPAAAVVGGGTLLGIVEPTPAERGAGSMGAGDLRVTLPGDHTALEKALALLPAAARAERIFSGEEDVRVPGRRLRARVLAAPPGAFDPAGPGAGMIRVVAGRAPLHSGEAALSPSLLADLGVGIGGRVTLAYGPVRAITGVVADPEALDQPLIVRTRAVVEDRGVEHLLVAFAGASPGAAAAGAGESAARRLRTAGFTVLTRAEAGEGDGAVAGLIALLGAVGFLEAALVIAAAFAVGMRRRQREIGLLRSLGAPVGHIGAALLLSAVTLALTGAALGALAGTLAAAAAHPFLDGWNRRWNGAFEIAPEYAAGALVCGVLAATLAAALPVFSAARLPIRVALGSRRPVADRPRRWLVAGLAIEATACAIVLTLPFARGAVAGVGLVAGALLGVLGFGLSSPWLLERLARGAAALPLAWRLAVRDAGRFRARNGPVVTAVLAGMSMSVTVAALVASVDSAIGTLPAKYRDDQILIEGPQAEAVARRLADALPSVTIAPLAAVYANGMPLLVRAGDDSLGAGLSSWVACGDADLLRALGAERGAGAFRAGRFLALDPPFERRRPVVTVWRGAALAWADVERVPAAQHVAAPAALFAADALEARGLQSGPPPGKSTTPWVARLAAPVTAKKLEAARAIAAASRRTTVDAALLHRGPARAIHYALLAACALAGLVVVLVATALSAAESAGDQRVLHTVGAAPALLSEHLAARAAYLALLGCALAVPAGLLTAAGLLSLANFGLPFVVPWRDAALVVTLLPATAYAVAWGSSHRFVAPGARALLAACVATMLCGVGGPRGAAADTTGAIRWEPFTGKAADGSPLAGELGRIRVPEKRGEANGRTIEIAFVRYRTARPDAGPPLFFLEGGPGGSGAQGCAFPATHPALRLLEHCDVIGIDQRGTGLSRPNLAAPEFGYTLPLDRAIAREDDVAAFTGAVARAMRHWRARGVDLTAYNSEESADDIDDVRRALGVEKVVTFGASYGSHLALAHLRRHPESVARAVLQKVEGPDHTWKLPGAVQRRLAALDSLATADPRIRAMMPGLMGPLAALIDTLGRRPVTVAVGRERTAGRVTLGAYDLRYTVAHMLASTRTSAGLADFLARLSRGDWTPLAEAAIEHRRGGVLSAMGILIDCASGASATRRARIRREAADPANLLGDAIHAPFYPESCAPCGEVDLGDAFRAPITSAVPVLFVSGTLDARTPPANVEEIRGGFSGHAHVIVRNAGHDPRELIAAEYRELLQAFIRGEPVESATIELPFRFEPGVER